MALNDSESPLHIQSEKSPADPVSCDYVEVEIMEGDQPRFVLRPHHSEGTPVGTPLILEIEGVRSLSAKLDHILNDEKPSRDAS